MTEGPEIITATIATFTQMSGLSRATIYRMMDSGALRSVKIGTRRLVVVESYREYLASLRSPIDSPISLLSPIGSPIPSALQGHTGAHGDTAHPALARRMRGES